MGPLLVALVLSPTALHAQQRSPEDSIPLVHAPAIVVTPHRAATPAARVASSVTVITRAELDRRQVRTVLDALRDVPGVAIVQTGGAGGVTSAFLRGAAADHALVLVDGVEVNDPSAPSNAYDFANLLTADVERIEVLRGPQSTLYGSSAMGGVIQIFTRRGTGPARAAASIEGGTFGSSHVALSVAGGSERLSYALTAADRRTGGISAAPAGLGNRERDAHRALDLATRLEWRPTSGLELGALARRVDAATDIDRGTPTGDDPNFVSDADELSGRAWGRVDLLAGRWRQTAAVEITRHDRDVRDEPDPDHPLDRSRATFAGRRWSLEWLHEVELAGHVVAGIETERETAASDFTSESEFGPFSSELPDESARTTGAFVHHESEIGPVSLAVGARIDDHNRFGAATTFRAASVVELGDTRIKATFGTGFKAPTLFQLFDPQFGNPDLDPESSSGWDAGVEEDLAGGRLRLGATVFAADFEDLVGFEFPQGYRNVSAASSQGVEATVSLLARENVRLRAGYTLTDAEDESAGSEDVGKPLLRRPRHQGSVSLEAVASGRADLALELRLVGKRDDKDFAQFPAARVTLDGYALLRVAASYRVSEALRLFGRVENALGADYEEAFGFGTPGRAAYAGIRAAF